MPHFVAGAETLPLTEAKSRSASTLAVKALVACRGRFGWLWVKSMHAAPCQRSGLGDGVKFLLVVPKIGGILRFLGTTMFIRIKRRRVVDPSRRRTEKIPANVDLFTLDFVVVRSVRTDKGPRQRVVKHLGSISERRIQRRDVGSFYHYRIERGLRALAETAPPGTYEKLLAQMHKLLPPVGGFVPPDPEELMGRINELLRGMRR